MAASKLKPSSLHAEIEDSDSHSNGTFCSSDNSDEDPTFDIIKETSSRLSKISITKPRKVKAIDLECEDFEESCRVEIPELNEKDGKSFEKVEELIKDGQLEKLKIEQCKLYLRKYGLRLTGNKGVLVDRIKLHLEVINGGGEKKYPASSFVLNCKGDACTGDVVMFEQKVYEMYSIASRSATGPPCGTRVVAGRIVKESYGAAKQQHTFTIEVLWSTGEKPLPPLHPLLIKGRNLYRLGTMRQKWDDEEERRRVIQEKHFRGNDARSTREVRIKEKEYRKLGNPKRTVSQTNQEKPKTSNAETKPEFKSKNNTVLQQNSNRHYQNHHTPANQIYSAFTQQDCKPNHHTPVNQIYPDFTQQHHTQHQLHTTTAIPTRHTHQYHSSNYAQNENLHPMHHGQVSRRYEHNSSSGYYYSGHHQGRHGPMSQRGPPRQWCRYYRQGKCHYGDTCKFLHE